MAEERVERLLAAILVADVVGYSALIRADEEGTRNGEAIDVCTRSDPTG